ncbi:MAG: exosortase-associated EpsI family protein [Limisphaerales bacterium]
MTREKQIVVAATVLLIAMTAGALGYLKRHQKLGEPGVKVVPVPLLDENGEQAADQTVFLPPDVDGYRSEALPMQRLVLNELPADTTYGQREYHASDGFRIRISAVLMGADRTSIHQPQYCVTGLGYRIERDEADTIKLVNGKEVPVRKMLARGEFRGPGDTIIERNQVLVYWFVTNGSLTADHEERMWQQAVNQLKTGVLQRWAYVTCVAGCEEGKEDEAFARVLEFIRQSAPEFLIP